MLKRVKKYEPIARLVIGVVHDVNILCGEDGATSRLHAFVGITFFGHVVLKRHGCFISMPKVLLFLCQMIDYCFESLVS